MMQIIPVIDLMHGRVVRGVGGQREHYREIESSLVQDALPASSGTAFAAAGFRTAYVADLDAIAGQSPAWSVYSELMDAGLDLCVDAGLTRPEQAVEMAQFSHAGRPLAAVVAGLESLDSVSMLEQICLIIGQERLIFSLDLKAGWPLTQGSAWQGLNAVQIATIALRIGLRRLIVLDLASVGMARGPSTLPLCRMLRCLDGDIEIISGGGVRGQEDLTSLARCGCDAALVASALHDGRLDAQHCARKWL